MMRPTVTTDRVCGANVNVERIVVIDNNVRFRFCSRECRDRFLDRPDAFPVPRGAPRPWEAR